MFVCLYVGCCWLVIVCVLFVIVVWFSVYLSCICFTFTVYVCLLLISLTHSRNTACHESGANAAVRLESLEYAVSLCRDLLPVNGAQQLLNCTVCVFLYSLFLLFASVCVALSLCIWHSVCDCLIVHTLVLYIYSVSSLYYIYSIYNQDSKQLEQQQALVQKRLGRMTNITTTWKVLYILYLLYMSLYILLCVLLLQWRCIHSNPVYYVYFRCILRLWRHTPQLVMLSATGSSVL